MESLQNQISTSDLENKEKIAKAVEELHNILASELANWKQEKTLCSEAEKENLSVFWSSSRKRNIDLPSEAKAM